MQCVHVLPVANRQQDQTTRIEVGFGDDQLEDLFSRGASITELLKLQDPNIKLQRSSKSQTSINLEAWEGPHA
jgi:hypothetical protein